MTIKYNDMKKSRLIYFISLLLLASSVLGQHPVVVEYDSVRSSPGPAEIVPQDQHVLVDVKTEREIDFSLQLFRVKQFMQSAQLIFELTNHTEKDLTNFWVHVSLLDRNGQFLYREEPLLFVNLQPGQKALREILCESVGIEEIGHVVVYPVLLELDRNETSFRKERVALEQNVELPIRFAFYSAYTW